MHPRRGWEGLIPATAGFFRRELPSRSPSPASHSASDLGARSSRRPAAIAHLTKCLAVEWGRYNITVNAVAPTFIFTPGTEEALADPAFRADTIQRIAALHRIGEPMEVAGAVVFLASPAASLITGHTILIDGGWTAR